jgi:hypothetical protein
VGLISRYKSAKAFFKLEEEVKTEGFALALTFQTLEVFEILLRIWESQMRRHGKTLLSMNAEHFVHFWSVTSEFEKNLELLARHISAYVFEDFHKLTGFHELEKVLEIFVHTTQKEKGIELWNEAFRKQNPRSWETFFQKHQRGPFTPEDSSEFEKLLHYS